MSVLEICAVVQRDRAFYSGGGGVTLSGGEPFYQPLIALDLLKKLNGEGLNVCVETSGMTSPEILAEAAPFVDIFLYDVKEFNCEAHEKYTGAPNSVIFGNLIMLNSIGASIILRCPIIPGLNDTLEHFRRIGELANSLENVIQIDVEPYHPLGLSKGAAVGLEMQYKNEMLTDKRFTSEWAEQIKKHTLKNVVTL
jgi:pyruvate formate lyase activating enzyme